MQLFKGGQHALSGSCLKLEQSVMHRSSRRSSSPNDCFAFPCVSCTYICVCVVKYGVPEAHVNVCSLASTCIRANMFAAPLLTSGKVKPILASHTLVEDLIGTDLDQCRLHVQPIKMQDGMHQN